MKELPEEYFKIQLFPDNSKLLDWDYVKRGQNIYIQLYFKDPDKISKDDLDKLRITFGDPYVVFSQIGTPLVGEDLVQEANIPEQTQEIKMPPVAEAFQAATKAGGLAGAIGMITGSAAILFSFIGFSEILAFLPMINLDYNENLKGFFKGISGLNFKLYDAGAYLELFITFDLSYPEKAERFMLAGFESKSFILNTSDVLLFFLITLAFALLYLFVYQVTKRN